MATVKCKDFEHKAYECIKLKWNVHTTDMSVGVVARERKNFTKSIETSKTVSSCLMESFNSIKLMKVRHRNVLFQQNDNNENSHTLYRNLMLNPWNTMRHL